jgi:Flp pilus assembly protein TadB
MYQVFRMMCREAYAKDGAAGLVRLWFPAIWDLGRTAAYRWIVYLLSERGKMMDTSELDRQIGDMTWCITTGLFAGYSFRQTIEAMAKEAPEPAASACKRLLADFEQGLSFETALANWKNAFPSNALARLVEVVLYHRQTGGNLGILLEPLSDDLVRQHGSDPAFHPAMREEAEILGRKDLPDRIRD